MRRHRARPAPARTCARTAKAAAGFAAGHARPATAAARSSKESAAVKPRRAAAAEQGRAQLEEWRRNDLFTGPGDNPARLWMERTDAEGEARPGDRRRRVHRRNDRRAAHRAERDSAL